MFPAALDNLTKLETANAIWPSWIFIGSSLTAAFRHSCPKIQRSLCELSSTSRFWDGQFRRARHFRWGHAFLMINELVRWIHVFVESVMINHSLKRYRHYNYTNSSNSWLDWCEKILSRSIEKNQHTNKKSRSMQRRTKTTSFIKSRYQNFPQTLFVIKQVAKTYSRTQLPRSESYQVDTEDDNIIFPLHSVFASTEQSSWKVWNWHEFDSSTASQPANFASKPRKKYWKRRHAKLPVGSMTLSLKLKMERN